MLDILYILLYSVYSVYSIQSVYSIIYRIVPYSTILSSTPLYRAILSTLYSVLEHSRIAAVHQRGSREVELSSCVLICKSLGLTALGCAVISARTMPGMTKSLPSDIVLLSYYCCSYSYYYYYHYHYHCYYHYCVAIVTSTARSLPARRRCTRSKIGAAGLLQADE